MKRKGSLLLLTFLLAIAAAGCTGNASEVTSEEGKTIVKVGLVGEMAEMWVPIQENLEDDGIQIELIKFADYTLPNQALADGEIDLNAFQHYAFLYNEVEAKGLDLVPIGNTIIAPLNVYSLKLESIDQIKEGDKIAIPNDVTNGGRALKVLESAGLIEVDPQAGYNPSVGDITRNPLQLEIIEVEASNLPSLLPDVSAAVINGNHAHDHGLKPAEDAIYSQSIDSIESNNPYINIIAARAEDAENEVYLKVVDAYNQPNVADVINETYDGLYVPAWFEN
jgi:D-methionine transport system substrate-binding protein